MFKLPPRAFVQPVKQTLVQMDVPPDIVLKHEVPLPTVLLWTQSELPLPRKQFIAPPVKAIPKVTRQLLLAPVLEAPNREVEVADLNVAAAIPVDTARLVRPPAMASPIATPGQEPAKEIPQIGLENSAEPNPANVISLPNSPVRPGSVLVLPPANQIASADSAGGSSGGGSGPGGAKGSGSGGTSKLGAAGSIEGSGSGNSGEQSSFTAGSGSSGSGPGRNGLTGVGVGGGTASNAGGDGSGTALATAIPGTTRLTLPKDGKFGVVVLGSAGSAPYPESVGALSGKMVYTVYLKLGLRKSWILQYCLPGTAERAGSGRKGSTPPLSAPWPFLMLRPDQIASDPNYIMIHGMLTSAGELDQLAMVFPEELERRDLILKSLKLWAFRPATRDGEPVAVEVLLIIPNESE